MRVLLCLFIFVSACSLFAAFEWKNGRLKVKTSDLELQFRNGVISHLKTSKSVFSSGSTAIDSKLSRNSLYPAANAVGEFTRIGDDEVRISYVLDGDKKLFYDFKTADDAIFIRAGFQNIDLAASRNNFDLHVPGLIPQAVITGIGSRTVRNAVPREERMLWPGSGFYFPRVLIAENPDSVILFYNESPMPYHNLHFIHKPTSDHVILRCGDNDLLKRTGKLLIGKKKEYLSGYWKISAHKNWLEAARAWQNDFEKRTGAKKLWENSSATVRNTHAVFTGMPDLLYKEDPETYYRKLAAEYDPRSLLLFYWNANSIITYGDHRYTTNGKPVEALRTALHKYGFQWIGFHAFTILLRDAGAIKKRHNAAHMKKYIPANYTYRPDYAGKPVDFYSAMKPYFSTKKSDLGYLNPASLYVEKYLVRNILNYAKYHKIPGFYLDITGEINYNLNKDKMVFDNRTYQEGEASVFRHLRKENPELSLMTEYNGEWLIPYIFYTWEGKNAMKHKEIRINHPLRGALYGSYFWSRETTTVDMPLCNAYYATLPEVLGDFSPSGREKHLVSEWHNERAKLFIREKLHNALPPDSWEPEALAYYRSAKNGFFQFRKMPFGYAYTDGKKNVLLGIYEKVRIGLPGFRIPGWNGYDRTGKAIGLDPTKSYRFVKKQNKDLPFVIEELPENSVITYNRQQKNWADIRIESPENKKCTGTICFKQKPLWVFVNGKSTTVNGSALNFSGISPLSLVVVYKDDSLPVDRKALQSKNWTFGYEDVNGLPATVGYRGYYFNMFMGMGAQTFSGVRKQALSIGCGRHSGYGSRLAKIPSTAKKLRFALTLKKSGKDIPMQFTVQLNGVDVFRKTLLNMEKWEEHAVDVSAFAGKTALLTFQFRYADPLNRIDQNINNILRIGDIDFE